MTNREKINAMSDKELTEFIRNVRKDELFPYYDFPKWLSGTDRNPSVVGKKAWYLKGSSPLEKKVAENEGREVVIEKVPCHIVAKDTFYSRPYYTVVLEGRTTIMKMPVEMVETA